MSKRNVRRMERSWPGAVLVGAVLILGCRDRDGGGGEEGAGTGTAGTGVVDDAGDEGAATGPGTTGDAEPEAIPAPGGLRRLLARQYTASIELLLGADAAAAAAPPVDPSIGSFDALATVESVPSAIDIEAYEASASSVARAAVAAPSTLANTVPCVAAGPKDTACYTAVARDFGRLAWRRPLEDAQIERLVAVATEARSWASGDFEAGLEYLLTAILQSPRFLYLVEVGQPATDDEIGRELDAYELATRMSFFLLGRTPDLALLDLAADGGLDTEDGIRAAATDLLQQSASRPVVTAFYDEFLNLRKLPQIGKEAELFPLFSPELADAMRLEGHKLIEDIIFEQHGSVLDLFDADYTFVDSRLAEVYGVTPPAAGQWKRVTFPAGQNRAGILSQSGWLAAHAHNNMNSPTRRGLFVARNLLCVKINPPPPGVPEFEEPEEGATLREALTQHLQDPACNGCHAVMDPVGFAFEHYDAIGAYRTLDNGKPIDSSGDIPNFGSFANAAELAARLREDERLPRCLVDQVYATALGWTAGADQEPALDTVSEAFAADDHRFRTLLVELVASPVFRRVDEPK